MGCTAASSCCPSSGSGFCESDDLCTGPLREHYLAEAYALGQGLATARGTLASPYHSQTFGSHLALYQHSATGVKVWAEAVELTPAGSDDLEVLFHYTSLDAFLEIAGRRGSWRGQLWSALSSQQPILQAEGHCCGRGGAVASKSEPAMFRNRGHLVKVLGLRSEWASEPLFCVPLLVHSSMARGLDEVAPSVRYNAAPPAGAGAGHAGEAPQVVVSSSAQGPLRILWPDDVIAAAPTAALASEKRRRAMLRVREATLGADDPETLVAVSSLGIALQSLGNTEEAEKLLRRGLAAREAKRSSAASAGAAAGAAPAPPTPSPKASYCEVLDALCDLAWSLEAQGRLREAEAVCQRMLRGAGAQEPDAKIGEELSLRFEAHRLAADVLLHIGQLEDAIGLLRQEVDRRRASPGAGAAPGAGALGASARLALALAREGESSEAEAMLREAQEGWTKLCGAGCPQSLAIESRLVSLPPGGGGGAREPNGGSGTGDKSAGADGGKPGGAAIGTEALETQRQLVKSLEAAWGGEHEEVMAAKGRLVQLLLDGGRADEAAVLCGLVVHAAELVHGPMHPATIEFVAQHAAALGRQGKPGSAEEPARRALHAVELALGAEHPAALEAAGRLAGLLRKGGKVEEAETLYRSALLTSSKVLGEGHPGTVQRMCLLAEVLHASGKQDEAEELYRQAEKLQIAAYGEHHPETLAVQSKLGMVLKDAGDLAEAEAVQRAVVAAREAELGMRHADTMASRYSLAQILEQRSKFAEAEALFGEELAWSEAKAGVDADSTSRSIRNLARFYEDRGRFPDMEAMYRRVLELYEAKFGSDTDHPGALAVISDFAKLLELQEKFDEAESLHRHVLQRRESVFGPEQPETLVAADNLGALLQKRGEVSEAEPLHQRALAGLEAKLGAEHPSTLASMSNFAALLMRQGKLNAAEAMHRQVLQVREAKLGSEHRETVASVSALADVLIERNKLDKAEPLVRRGLVWSEKTFGRRDGRTLAASKRLSQVREALKKAGGTAPNKL